MILTAFTLFHVVLSLVGIGAGFIVLYGLLTAKLFNGWTRTFLTTTVATSVTGFLFPVEHFMPSHVVGMISLLLLTFAILALRRYHLSGAWRWTYVITSVMALYLNVFVLIVQLFRKVPALQELAPTQSEPPFAITQIAVLLFFIVLGALAGMRFRGAPLRTA